MYEALIVFFGIMLILPVTAVLMHEVKYPPLRDDQIIDSHHPHRVPVRNLTREEASWPRR